MNHILLYSNFSRSCLRLLDTVDELNQFIKLDLLCIDNKDVRKRIISSKTFEIKKVPCLLILNDTTVEKYEGEKVFQWMSEIVENFKSQLGKQTETKQNRIHSKGQVKKVDEEEEVKQEVDEEENHEVEQKKEVRVQNKSRKSKINMTRIEDLDDVEEENEISKKVRRPPVPVRNGADTYSFGDDTEMETSYVPPNKVKKSGDSGGGSGVNIMDMAMAMRQEREKENKDRDNNK